MAVKNMTTEEFRALIVMLQDIAKQQQEEDKKR